MQSLCWICPECSDDKNHEPGDDRCLRYQMENALSSLLIMCESNASLRGWNANDFSEIRQARAALAKATGETNEQ